MCYCSDANKTITNKDTDTKSQKHFLFFQNDTKVSALAKVFRVDKLPERNEMLAYCKGLDSIGGVFDLELVFMSDDFATLEWVIENELQAGAAYAVEGNFTVQNGVVRLHDPEFGKINDTYTESVLAVFRANESDKTNRLAV